MEWTDEQRVILDYWKNPTQNVAVRALAGSGKTTLILGAMELHPETPSLYTAFMKKNVTDIAGELASEVHEAATLNSIGSKILYAWWKQEGIKAQRVSQFKYWNIVEDIMQKFGMSKQDNHGVFMDIVDLVSFTRSYLMESTTENIAYLGEMYGIAVNATITVIVSEALRVGREQLHAGLADFDDQLWGPYTLGIEPTTKYPLVYIDEVQDLSKAKLNLASLLVEDGGRVMIAGDEFQSVMGFSGADTDSYQNAVKHFNRIEFSVTRSFRFGPNIAQLSKGIVPNLVGAAADPGEVRQVSVIPRDIDVHAAIISRYNKPLVGVAMQLLHARIPFYMHSSKLMDSMLRELKDMKGNDFGNLKAELLMHKAFKGARMREEGKSERYIASFEDTMECLIMACEQSHAIDMAGFISEIQQIFKKQDGVTLITAHAAKGSQWKQVWLLAGGEFGKSSEKWPAWVNQQEQNVYYVALTRPRLQMNLLDKDYEIEQPKISDEAAALAALMAESGLTIEDILNAAANRKQ